MAEVPRATTSGVDRTSLISGYWQLHPGRLRYPGRRRLPTRGDPGFQELGLVAQSCFFRVAASGDEGT